MRIDKAAGRRNDGLRPVRAIHANHRARPAGRVHVRDNQRPVGLDLDATGFGMGTRSHRYAMIIDDGRVTSLHVEPQAGQAEVSSAEAILADL